MKRATKAKPTKTAAKVDEMHVCIGCGQRDTASKSRICGQCLHTRSFGWNDEAVADYFGESRGPQPQDGDDENHNDTKEFA